MNDENGTQAIEIAENPEFGRVRIKWHDNQYLFAGKDVAKALGYKRPENAVTQHCKGILKLVIPSAGGIQETRFITEGDVYRLIIRSKLPDAQRFEKWVFDEVLPSIRLRGLYLTSDLLAQVKRNPDLIYRLAEEMLKERQKNEILQKELLEAKPKAVSRITRRQKMFMQHTASQDTARLSMRSIVQRSHYTRLRRMPLMRPAGRCRR